MTAERERAHRIERIRSIQRTWRDVGQQFDAVAETMIPGGHLNDTARVVYELGTRLHDLSEAITEMNELVFGRTYHSLLTEDDQPTSGS